RHQSHLGVRGNQSDARALDREGLVVVDRELEDSGLARIEEAREIGETRHAVVIAGSPGEAISAQTNVRVARKIRVFLLVETTSQVGVGCGEGIAAYRLQD